MRMKSVIKDNNNYVAEGYYCMICLKTFDTKKECLEHIKNNHNEVTK